MKKGGDGRGQGWNLIAYVDVNADTIGSWLCGPCCNRVLTENSFFLRGLGILPVTCVTKLHDRIISLRDYA
jgi:hypothetical protein